MYLLSVSSDLFITLNQRLNDYCSDRLSHLAGADRLRQRRGIARGAVHFASNDYLGISSHPGLIDAAQQELTRTPRWGAGASPVVGGHCPAHADLEATICDLSNAPAAASFSSGYACNVGVVSSLFGRGDLLLSDALNHACLIDGCRLSKASVEVYPHLNTLWVEDFLKTHRGRFQRVGILTESVFSMDGDGADLLELQRLALDFDCELVVDEAHATGVYGQRGGGMLESSGLTKAQWPENIVKLGTLSKAVGCIGGFVAASKPVVDYLINSCRSYLFSTSQPPVAAAVAAKAIRIAMTMSDERARLQGLARQLRSEIAGHEATSNSSGSGQQQILEDCPIVPFVVGQDSRAIGFSDALLAKGMYVPAIRPPTVPEGASRLRISLSANHTAAQVATLAQQLRELTQSL